MFFNKNATICRVLPCTFTSKSIHSANDIVKKNNCVRLISKEKQRRKIMDELMIKNFFYTSTPENEGVLFHIPTGRFSECLTRNTSMHWKIELYLEILWKCFGRLIQIRPYTPVHARSVIVR